jgi:nitrite reductase/ring-hydroxylating ferredoxin subunit
MNWIEVLAQDELPEGARQVVKAAAREILLINHQGQIHAVESRCPHMGASLARGEVTDEDTIICPRHHSVFGLQSGDVKDWAPWPPGVGRVLGAISPETTLPVFPTKVEKGSIWVGLEETM